MRLPALLLILFLVFSFGCAAPRQADQYPLLSGRTMLDGKPVAGVVVEAFPATAAGLAEASPYRSAATGEDGVFQLPLPVGRYFLLARGQGLFAYYGPNPVTLDERGLKDVSIGLVHEDPILPEVEAFAINGAQVRASLNGQALAGVTLYAYLDLTSELKGMGYVMTGPSDDAGIVEATLPAGTYYLLARKRAGGQAVGPLRAGDFVGYYPGNPIKVGDGELLRLSIPMLEVPAKSEELQAEHAGQTLLKGVIRDAAGKPVAGARAILYRDAQMLNRPDYVSNQTGPDGRFTLSLPSGGTYYLVGRNTLGGAPGPGELYGTYNATLDHSIVIESGAQKDGLEIQVEEMW